MTTDPLTRLREACEYLDGPGWEDPQAQNAFEGVATPRLILALLDELTAARAVVLLVKPLMADAELMEPGDNPLWEALCHYDATIAKGATDA